MLLDTPPDGGLEPSQPSPAPRFAALGEIARRVGNWAMGHRKLALLAALAALTTLVGIIAVVVFLRPGHRDGAGRVDPAAVLSALDAGNYEEARRLATILQHQDTLPPEAWGVASYALGVVEARQAEQALGATQRDLYLIAARYLDEARDRGFPRHRQEAAILLLGKCLYSSGQFTASRSVLEEALKQNPREKANIHRLLAGAYLNGAKPLFQKALAHNALALGDSTLSADARNEVLLQRVEILVRMGKHADALAALDRLPAGVRQRPEALLLRGWSLAEEARKLADAKGPPKAAAESRRRLQAALGALRAAQTRDTLASHVSGPAMYLIGVCLDLSGDAKAALEQFRHTIRQHGGSAEALAAGLRSAELLRRLGRHREALAAYREVLTAAGVMDTYSNPWVSWDDLRRRVLEAYRSFCDQRDFAAALQLAMLRSSLFTQVLTLQLAAEAYQAWGRNLIAQAEAQPDRKAAPLLRRGRELLRRAGSCHAQLAQLHLADREYADDLWNAAEAYLQGQDFQAAVKVLREYLKNESRRRYCQALVNLAEALLAVGRVDEALASLRECIQAHPRDPASFRARLLASKAYLEKGQYQAAKKLLAENLRGDLLAPESVEWRDSLLELGRVLYSEGRFSEALGPLEEAAARYPDSPQTAECRYLAAGCHRLRARQLQEQSYKERLPSVRQAHDQHRSEALQSALQRYESLRDDLDRRRAQRELGPLEEAILRNCVLFIGAALYELGRYEASAEASLAAANRYYGEPASLEAYVQAARAFRRMGRTNQARTAIDQAKVALARIKDGPRFVETTNYSKQQWAEVLDRLATL